MKSITPQTQAQLNIYLDTLGKLATAMEAVLVEMCTRTLSASEVPLLRVKLLRWPRKSAPSFNVMSTATACLVWRSARSTGVRIPSVEYWSNRRRPSTELTSTVKPTKQNTFFDNAKPSLSAPLFTVDLKKGAPGSYSFGFIDDSKYKGNIAYVPVDQSKGFWGFTSRGFAVGGGSFRSVSINSIADTGTSLLYLPDSVVDAYYGSVSSASYNPNQGGYIFPCGTTLPSITLGIGSYDAVIPGSFIEYAPIDEAATGESCLE